MTKSGTPANPRHQEKKNGIKIHAQKPAPYSSSEVTKVLKQTQK